MKRGFIVEFLVLRERNLIDVGHITDGRGHRVKAEQEKWHVEGSYRHHLGSQRVKWKVSQTSVCPVR